MTATQTQTTKQKNQRPGKKQKSPVYANIGTPPRAVRPSTKKHQPELLSDWDHAS